MAKSLAVFHPLANNPPAVDYAQIGLRNGHVVLEFDPSTAEAAISSGVLPASYQEGDLSVVALWTSDTTSGDVKWEAALERHPVGDATAGTIDVDADAFGVAASTTSAAPSAAGELVRTEIAVSATDAGSPIAGESFRLRLRRDAADSADTLAGDAQLLGFELREA